MTPDPRGSSPPSDTARLLLTIPELAAELRIDKRTVYRLLKAGELPIQVLRVGQSPRVRRADLEHYLEQLSEQAAAEGAERTRRTAAMVWGSTGRPRRVG
jgi:excisionase family DNA binding protein